MTTILHNHSNDCNYHAELITPPKKLGRPRKYPLPDPNTPKNPRGRPKVEFKRDSNWYYHNSPTYRAHKMEYDEANSVSVNCPCGSSVVKSQMCRHRRSEKHINYVNSLN